MAQAPGRGLGLGLAKRGCTSTRNLGPKWLGLGLGLGLGLHLDEELGPEVVRAHAVEQRTGVVRLRHLAHLARGAWRVARGGWRVARGASHGASQRG